MSVELEKSDIPARRLSRPLAETALGVRVDPRVQALVPRFDAPFFQAGLAGYSDGAMRLMARRHGCPFCVTEALLDRTLINGGKGRAREDPDLIATECGMGDLEDNIAATVDDHPLAGQIMGSDPDEMARAADLIVALGHEVVDVNLACPVKKIRSSNRGGHFLAHPDAAIAILRAVHAAVAGRVPVTAKLRRGYDDSPQMAANFERIFDAAYEIGCAWTTVHCRTVVQKYLGPGRWEFLEDLVARRGDRLIFGSGDIWSVEDIFAMMDQCGVSAVAVARGCIGNPWIFRQARQMMRGEAPSAPTLPEQRTALCEHLELARMLHGEQAAGRRMRKFGIKFASNHPRAREVKAEFISCTSLEEWSAVIDRFYLEVG
ncbi:MAG: tRNA-dihydrouridine synthase family protein [Phycisphaerales bacterium]|nr:tRNA-dihydrouridine synthase family protein [Phycisphaerales bacterium]